MDSLERLSHSLEQAVALIHSLRRENRELANQAASAIAAAREQATAETEALASELAGAKLELERVSQEAAQDLVSMERANRAELEAARMAEDLDKSKKAFQAEKQALELQLLAAAREETMPLATESKEYKELEAELEKAKGAITAMQVKIAESADPDEMSHWQEQMRSLEAELGDLRGLRDQKAGLDAEKAELRRQRKALAGIAKEREQVKAKLDEIHATLGNLRLN